MPEFTLPVPLPSRDTLSATAPLLFVALWSTGFIGAKVGLPYAEPFTFLALRFAIVVALLLAIVMATGARWPSGPREFGHVAVSGLLVHGIYLGGVFAAIHHGINAGVAAVIVGAQPLVTAALVGPLLGESLSARQWLGFVLGFGGVALVVWEKIDFTGADLTGFTLTLGALVGITFGTVYQKRFCTGMSLRSGSLVQYTAAAVLVIALSLWLETGVVVWSGEFVFALVWLIVVLSVGAVTLLWILIRRGAASSVASLFYLVPPVVAVESYFLFDERLGIAAMGGIALAAVGVALVNR